MPDKPSNRRSQRRTGPRLTQGRPATSTQWITDSVISGSVTQISDIEGDVTVSADTRAAYWIDEFSLEHPLLSVEQAQERLSRLLQVRYEIVEFVGRTSQLDHLRSWRDEPKSTSVMLLHATGGQGKSRLALHFARDCAQAGWRVFSGHQAYDVTGPISRVPEQESLGSTDSEEYGLARILIVVDYAERWPMKDLLELIADASRQDGSRIRVLLLSRPAGTWWQSLSYRIDQIGCSAHSMLLPPLAEQIEPENIFDAACQQFATALGISNRQNLGRPIELGRSAESGLVLAVHMAALARVDADRRGTALPDNDAEVSSYLLMRERDHWQHLHTQGRIRLDPDAMTHVTYTATLIGPLGYEEGLSAVRQARVGTNEHPDRILRDHALVYPPPPHSDRRPVLYPLYPDRLGEDFLALTTPGHGNHYESDPWAAEAPAWLIAGHLADLPSWAGRALTALIETARRWPHIATNQLYPLLRAHPRLALSVTGAALTTLAELPDIDLSVLEQIESQLPTERHTDLDTGIAAVVSRLTYHRLTTTTDPIARGDLYFGLSWVLFNAGRYAEALLAMQETVNIDRRLANIDPAAHERFLGMTLGNLGMILWKMERYEEALETATEVASISRRLAESNPAEHEPALALSLTNLGLGLAQIGDDDEALTITKEAVAIYRRLAEANPTKHEYELALSLINLGVAYDRTGQPDGSLRAAAEAAAIYRRLSEVTPITYGPEFAIALRNMGLALSELHYHEDAVVVMSEAVAIQRRLTETNPAAHGPDFTKSLITLAQALSELHHHEDAVTALSEAVGIYRRLIESGAAHASDLGSSLRTISAHLYGLERHEEAVAAIDEAITIYRRLAGTASEYLADLATALWTSGLIKAAAPDTLPEALSALEESVRIYRRLHGGAGAKLGKELRAVLPEVARLLESLGQPQHVAAIHEELRRMDAADGNSVN